MNTSQGIDAGGGGGYRPPMADTPYRMYSLRMPADLIRDAQQAADARGTTVSDLMRAGTRHIIDNPPTPSAAPDPDLTGAPA